jgi:hypothetical protein
MGVRQADHGRLAAAEHALREIIPESAAKSSAAKPKF